VAKFGDDMSIKRQTLHGEKITNTKKKTPVVHQNITTYTLSAVADVGGQLNKLNTYLV